MRRTARGAHERWLRIAAAPVANPAFAMGVFTLLLSIKDGQFGANDLASSLVAVTFAPVGGLEEVEATVYFCVLEALQNVQKYAAASHAIVRLRDEGGALRFEVEDRCGFGVKRAKRGAGLTNIADLWTRRAEASRCPAHPGHGTRVSAAIPLLGQNAAAATPAAAGVTA